MAGAQLDVDELPLRAGQLPVEGRVVDGLVVVELWDVDDVEDRVTTLATVVWGAEALAAEAMP